MSTNSSDSKLDDSILNSIKKLLGLPEDYTPFDQDVLIHINTVFTMLQQMGVGPEDGFLVTSQNETWSEFLGPGELANLHSVKTYTYIKVRKIFDPPGASNHLAALDNVLEELEWRISVRREEVMRPTPIRRKERND